MIELRNIKKIYRTPEVNTIPLNNVSMSIKEGEFISITGPSGCGKTTLLNILGLLDSPDNGDYFFDGKNIAKYSELRITSIRKNSVGFIFQNFNLIDELNVFKNIEIPLLYHKIPLSERVSRINNLVEKLSIKYLMKKFPQQLSGGEQQRVAVARAMVANPRFIIADEPTGNLDSKNANDVINLLKTFNKEGTTIIMVTHDLKFASVADRIIKLQDGTMIK